LIKRLRGWKFVRKEMNINSINNQTTYASKEDIDKLLLDILPGVLDEKQRKNKIRNLVYAMSKKR